MNRSYRFSHAITRLPSESVVNGLRFDDIGNPNFEQMLLDHEDYSLALREAGAEIIQLPPLQNFPDSTFVEDTVLCLSNLAILMRPGAPSRAVGRPRATPCTPPQAPRTALAPGGGLVPLCGGRSYAARWPWRELPSRWHLLWGAAYWCSCVASMAYGIVGARRSCPQQALRAARRRRGGAAAI